MKLFIKNMTSQRSKREVETIIKRFGLDLVRIEIVEVEEKFPLKRRYDLYELLDNRGYI